MAEDRIYADESDLESLREPFRFDATVAGVFPDMLKRSIPGYLASIEAIGSLAARFVRSGTRCYDLGCSLGAATTAIRQAIQAKEIPDCRILAIDNARAMVERCREILAADRSVSADAETGPAIEVILGDIRETVIRNASMAVLNYTLQFIEPADRDRLIRRVRDGLNDGGVLVLSEKVVDPDPAMERLLVDLHHEHKRRNRYSALEIARKRAALENVLVPETVAAHRKRLEAAGFSHVGVWLRYFNFVSIVAIR